MTSRSWLSFSLVCLCLLPVACAEPPPSSEGKSGGAGNKGPLPDLKVVKLPSGLEYQDITVGEGAEAKKGQKVEVHYTGWLARGGKKFDSSVDRGEPFSFLLGAGGVIKGWDLGVVGMKVGGKRRLLIPSDLGYGERGAGKAIPPDADLVFDVELLKVGR